MGVVGVEGGFVEVGYAGEYGDVADGVVGDVFECDG